MKRKQFVVLGLIIILVVGTLIIFKNRIFASTNFGPYTIFQAENFSQVTWDTLPGGSNKILKEGSLISTFAAQGQTEDISFSVRPNVDLGEVQINLSDLKSGDKVIEKKNIEVLNLKVWDQCWPKNSNDDFATNCQNRDKSQIKSVPELLVKNSDQDLVEAEKVATPDLALSPNARRYNAPAVDQTFQATLVANKTHTFYLRINVPEDAVAGDYSGRVTFTKKVGTQGSFTPTNLKLSLKVYPFKLSESNKNISTFVGYRVDDNFFQYGMQSIGKQKFEEYLRFLKKSGLTSLIIQDYNNVVWVAEKMNELGFKEIIWRAEGYPENYYWDATKRNDIKTKIAAINEITKKENASLKRFYVYGPDEVWGGDRAFASVAWNKFIHSAGGKIATTAVKQNYDMYNNNQLLLKDAVVLPDEFKDADYKIDLPIYAAGYKKSVSNLEPTQYYDVNPKGYFDMSWYFQLAMVTQKEGTVDKKYFDVPVFTAMVRGKYMNTTQSYNNRYTKSLSQGGWHHIAGVWDGPQNKYSLYIDSEPAYTISAEAGKEFGSKIVKNPMRTFIGGQPDRIGQVNPGQDNFALSTFHGQIARVKVYNNALTQDQFKNSESVVPEADYDFSAGALADKTGKYPTCINRGASVVNDNPIAGKKSLNFDNGKYGEVYSDGRVWGREGERGNYLDCGMNPNNYNIDDKMTVEAWVKIPSRPGNFTNLYQGTIISQIENLPNRNYTTIEKHVESLIESDRQAENEYFYNQLWPDHVPASNFFRGLSGFYLQGSRLSGYAPYGMDSAFLDQGKFYDDFDTQTKTWFAVLPNANGEPVKSLQFEAFRTGVDDSRYISTYENLLAELKTKKPKVAQQFANDQSIKNMLNSYPYNSRTQVSFAGKLNPGDSGYVAPFLNSKHQENRKLVAEKIKAIVEALGVPDQIPSQTTSNQVTYKFAPGLNIVGSANLVGITAGQITSGTSLKVKAYNPLTKQWIANPGNNFTLSNGMAFYVENPTNQVVTKTVSGNQNTAATSNPRLYKDANFMFNETRRELKLAQIKVDVYDGNNCLAKNVSLDQLKDSEYIVKRPYIISDTSSIKTPTLQEASSAPGIVNVIPAKKGYWIFVKNNIQNIIKDTKFIGNRCN